MTMTSKRSRVDQSPSLRDVCMFDQAKPIESCTEILHSTSIFKKSLVSEPNPPEQQQQQRHSRTSTIFTLGSSEWENEIAEMMRFDGEEAGGFLKACYRCRKEIGEKDDVFMYSSFGAFCSPECRAKQIALDNKSVIMLNMKGEIGALLKNGPPSKWNS